MNEPEAFIRAIAENLYDDAPRLIFADWLEEHSDPDRTEFIRVQCELEPMCDHTRSTAPPSCTGTRMTYC